MPNYLNTFKYFLAFVLLIPFTSQAATDDVTLVSGANAKVGVNDIMADVQRIPLDSRKEVLSKSTNISQAASNLFVRRVLAMQAQQEGLDKDPIVIAALKIAYDRVLSDARLAIQDASVRPTAQALDNLAKAKYRAEPKRFEIPAQTKASHILIRNEGPESLKKAEKILQELKAGANFEALAKEHSADVGSASKGGDLGFFGPGRMVKPFDDAVQNLSVPGALSGIVETQFGYHIIKLDARRPAGLKSYEEVKEDLYREIQAKVVNDARMEVINKLTSEAKFDQTAIEEFAKSQR